METAVVSPGDKSSSWKCYYISSPAVLIEGYAKFQWEIRENKHVFIFSSTLMGHPEICLWTSRVNTLPPALCGTSKSRGGPCRAPLVMEAFREFVAKVSFQLTCPEASDSLEWSTSQTWQRQLVHPQPPPTKSYDMGHKWRVSLQEGTGEPL